MSTDLIVHYFQRITNPYSIWASYRIRQVRFPPRQTNIYWQRTLFSKHEPIRTKARRRYAIITAGRRSSQSSRFSLANIASIINNVLLKHSTALMMVRSRSCFMRSTQEAQLLHYLVLEFPTLIRMYHHWHPESTHNMLKEGIRHRQCRFVRQWAHFRPSGKTVHHHQNVPIAFRSGDRHVQEVHCYPIPHQHVPWEPSVGTETCVPDKQYMMPGKNERRDAIPANRPDSVDDALSGKLPNVWRKGNHEICGSCPDAPG